MNPSSSPVQFVRNSSLVEYLATNCGMSLTKPNAEKKINMLYESVALSSINDVPGNIFGAALSGVYENTIGRLRSLFSINR